MRKILYVFYTIVITIMVASCSKEQSASIEPAVSVVSLSASAEDNLSKATLGGETSKTWTWTSGDQIGVYFYKNGADYDPWTATFNLKGTSSTTNGVFSWTGDPTDICWNVGAIYPKFGNSISWNNTNKKHYAYVELKTAYDYTAGQVFMPMVANMSSESSQPTGVNFKHVAAAVKVTLNNLPSKVAKVSITADKIISGWCNIAIPDAGTGVLVANGGDDGSSKTVAFNIESADIASSMPFYFPIRTIEDPTLYLSLINSDGEPFWSKKATLTTGEKKVTLGRGDILDLGSVSYSSDDKYIIVGIQSTWNADPTYYQVHYWDDSSAGDVNLNASGVQLTKDGRTYDMFSVKVPSDITGFRVKNIDGFSFGDDDGDASKYSKAFIYNDGSNKVIYE